MTSPELNPEEKLDHLTFALDAAGVGTWNLDPINKLVEWDDRCKEMFGHPRTDIIEFDQVLRYIHHDDRKRVSDAISTALTPDNKGLYDIDFRAIGVDGQLRWIHCRGKAYFKNRVAVRFAGIAQDITRLKLDEEKFSSVQTESAIVEQELIASEDRFRRVVEQAPMAIALLKGRDLVVEVCNDMILELWGKDKSIIGKKLIDGLPEIVGQGFLELLEGVYDTGKQYVGNGVKAKLVRRQILQDAYFDFAYTAVRDGQGNVNGVIVIATEVTEQTLIKKAVEESEAKFRGLIEQAPVATCVFVGPDLKIEVANEIILGYWGKDKSVLNKPIAEALPELKGQPFIGILNEVFASGKSYEAKAAAADLIIDGVLKTFYFDFTYKPLRNAEGEVYAIIDMALDVTEEVLNAKALEESKAQLQFAIDAAELGTWDLTPSTNKFVGNNRLKEWFGLPQEAEIDLSDAVNVILDKDKQRVTEAIQTALQFDSGGIFDIEYTIVNPRTKKERIVKAKGRAWFDETKKPYRFNGTLQDVTKEVNARISLQESEVKLRGLVESAPFPIGVYVGKEMRIFLANQTILDAWGKGNDVIGKLFSEILPELNNQEIFDQLDEVYTTGKAIHKRNQRVDLMIDGQLKSFYFNYSFSPLFEASGKVYAVMNTAADITDLVVANLVIEQTGESLRQAIELADLGTWDIDLVERELHYSERLRAWFGIKPDEVITVERAYLPIREEDRQLVRAAILHAINPELDGIYDVEYRLNAAETGKERIVHALGKSFFNEKGEAYKISGTAQDVTSQRMIQLALEQEVQKRTEELALSNEEIQATNEELAATNEELEESNYNLTHSNQELEQYAYVASHDLQEPLRKIRTFTDILQRQNAIPENGMKWLDKISQSAERMSLLILSLLDFSRLLKSDAMMRPVDLGQVIMDVATDFELVMEEKNAVIQIGTLPVIEAIGLQMNQLFYNLISNSLKFTSADVSPRIEVDSRAMSLNEVKKYIIKPLAFSNYYHITVSDNGIGFETQYAEHIFEIFKRLHGRDIYPGSGIGLALCKRIVNSHGGHIYVESEVGKGSVFNIILPDKRSNYQSMISPDDTRANN